MPIILHFSLAVYCAFPMQSRFIPPTKQVCMLDTAMFTKDELIQAAKKLSKNIKSMADKMLPLKITDVADNIYTYSHSYENDINIFNEKFEQLFNKIDKQVKQIIKLFNKDLTNQDAFFVIDIKKYLGGCENVLDLYDDLLKCYDIIIRYHPSLTEHAYDINDHRELKAEIANLSKHVEDRKINGMIYYKPIELFVRDTRDVVLGIARLARELDETQKNIFSQSIQDVLNGKKNNFNNTILMEGTSCEIFKYEIIQRLLLKLKRQTV